MPSDGTTPSVFVPLSVPEIRGREMEYVRECLETGWVSSVGPFVERFERAVARAAGAAWGVATVNGTSALHVALLAAGVRSDDEVLVSTLSFIAPANAIRYAGAWPLFVDAEPRYWQMDVGRVAEFLENGCERRGGELRNRRTGRRIGAVLPVHILGHPVDMDPLLEVCRRFEIPVVEDATESLGATYRGRPVGHLGDIACFSFNGNKIVTTGGGGMIVTDREDWARKARYLTTQAKDDPVEYVHHEIGFNYRLTNVLSAIGLAQMEQLPAYIEAKRAIAARYAEAFRGLDGVAPMRSAPWAESTFWLYTVRIAPRAALSSRELMEVLSEQQIQARPLWQPLHRSPAHAGAAVLGGAVAEELQRDALSLPSSVGLDRVSQERVVSVVVRALREGPAKSATADLGGATRG